MFPKHLTFTAGETEDKGKGHSGHKWQSQGSVYLQAVPPYCLWPQGAGAADFHCSKAIASAKLPLNCPSTARLSLRQILLIS